LLGATTAFGQSDAEKQGKKDAADYTATVGDKSAPKEKKGKPAKNEKKDTKKEKKEK